MAHQHALTRRARTALAVCLGLALAGHLVVLAWWQGHAGTGPALRHVAEPVFTRLIAPAEPPPPPPAPPGPVLKAPPPAIPSPGAVAVSIPAAPAAATASAPEPARAASEPSEAQAPAPAATEPRPDPAAPSTRVADIQTPAPAASPASVAASAPATAPRDTWPADTRLTYRLQGLWRGGPLYGGARVQWQRQGTQYQAQVEIDITPFAHRALTSQGEVTPRGLVPRVYEERSRTRRRAMRLGETDITLADGRSVPRPAEVQDTASQFVELGHRFATGQQPLTLGTSLTLWLARPGGVDPWTYDVAGQELVAIPRLGEVMAWRLRPRPPAQRRDNLSAEIWFAPSLQYLPVRIRLTLGEEAEIDLQVEAIEQR